MVKPVKFAHVVYQTRRFNEMIEWYRTVFEAEVVHQDPALAFMTYDDEHHRFAFANLSLLKPEAKGMGDRGDIGVNRPVATMSKEATEMLLRLAGPVGYYRSTCGSTTTTPT